MKKSSSKLLLSKYWYPITIGFILITAIFFRFYRYSDRWAFAGDQARDAIVARVAFHNFTLPLLGPFSSAGNFTTGFIWYTWLVASTAIFPNALLTPWVILTISYVGIVALMILIGNKVGGKLMGLLAGLYTAISPAQINQSFNLTNPSLVAIFSVLSIYFSLLSLETGGDISIFLLSFSVSLAISAHFQSVYLLILIPLTILSTKHKVKKIFIAFIGFLLPFIPYIIVDINHGFYNSRGIIDYILYGQNKIYVANRWLTYLFKFIPDLWGQIIGGNSFVGYISLILLLIFLIKVILQKKLSRQIILTTGSLLVILLLLRYYKGDKTPGYFIFIQPFVLLTTAWISLQSIRLNKYFGILLIVAISFGSSILNIQRIQHSINYMNIQVNYWGNLLMTTYPKKKFDVYTLNPPNGQIISLVLFLDSKNITDNNGYRIGFGTLPKYTDNYYTLLRNNKMGYDIWDINSSSSAQLTRVGWSNINPTYIYESTTQWYKKINDKNGFNKMLDLLFSKL